ncbi:hypothetical protein AB4248_25390 [Vibrio splendidus]
MSKSTNQFWGIFELENATRENSGCDVFGHFCVSGFAKLAIYE